MIELASGSEWWLGKILFKFREILAPFGEVFGDTSGHLLIKHVKLYCFVQSTPIFFLLL
uniref:Uncharacterized protein n=1 Tax=Anguilla anguilla TaxID=7936 RepID=A0A0E9PCT8_ANGAN